jgi:methionyl aminopeptidase
MSVNDTTRANLTRDGIRMFEKADFAGMHKAGALAARILDDVAEHVFVGQTTGAIDKFIEDKVNEAGATSATIGYKGYKHASCISVNHVVCHGIPSEKKLKDGDILNIDVTVIPDVCRWKTVPQSRASDRSHPRFPDDRD